MAIYTFGNSYTFMDVGRDINPIMGANTLNAIVPNSDWAISQLSDIEGGNTRIVEPVKNVEPLDVTETLDPGFHYLDDAMKMYWSDVRIPTKDSYRFMRTKVAGASSSLQIWVDDLRHARVQLPVMSISREDYEYNPEKFSPPYISMREKYLNRGMTRIKNIYRPAPYNVSYKLTIWAEHKRDAEFALKQILIRFNPLAEFVANDDHIHGTITNHLKSSSDVSEKEATAEQKAKVRYEVNIMSEAWLSLPETSVPSILGVVRSVDENLVSNDTAAIIFNRIVERVRR